MEKQKKTQLRLDPWQKEVLDYKGNIVVCSGRQTGKSTVVAIKAAEFAVNNPKKLVLIISVTEDQAIELLLKCQLYIADNYKKRIKMGKDRPTKQILRLTNGSMIRTKAVGQSGVGVRGFTIDMLIADEAAFMPEDVWPAVTPMLLTTGGDIILISTPHGKKGYFFQAYHNERFKTIHINTLEEIGKRPISESWNEAQKDFAEEFFESERERMSKREFGQEYLGLFIDDLAQFFPDEVIKRSMIQQRQVVSKENRDFFLGVDIARLGGDDTTFEVFERKGELLIHRESLVWKKVLLSQITEKIMDLDKFWHFKRIYLDDGGIGVGVFDSLYITPGFKKRVIALNNSKRIYEYNPDGSPKMKRLLKEDLYNNLLHLMEKRKIMILDDSNIWQSFKSVQYEYINQKGGAVMRIFSTEHSQSHIVEGIIRAAYCNKEKINKFQISYI
jgi:hypothetical protein